MNRVFTSPLRAEDDVADFDSGNPVLDLWLQERALRSESRFARTWVDRRGGKVAGYYCLSAGAIARDAAPGRLRRNAPDPVPIVILGRLAVDLRHAGRGLGSALLMDAIYRVATASETIGISTLLVHAIDDTARRFYLARAGFQEYPEGSRTMFLPIEQIRAALADA